MTSEIKDVDLKNTTEENDADRRDDPNGWHPRTETNDDDGTTIEEIHTQISQNFKFIEDELLSIDEMQVDNTAHLMKTDDSVMEDMNTEILENNELDVDVQQTIDLPKRLDDTHSNSSMIFDEDGEANNLR